jgi:hypothetical protein
VDETVMSARGGGPAAATLACGPASRLSVPLSRAPSGADLDPDLGQHG